MKERAVLCRLKGRRDMVGLDVAFGGGPGGPRNPPLLGSGLVYEVCNSLTEIIECIWWWENLGNYDLRACRVCTSVCMYLAFNMSVCRIYNRIPPLEIMISESECCPLVPKFVGRVPPCKAGVSRGGARSL